MKKAAPRGGLLSDDLRDHAMIFDTLSFARLGIITR